MFTPAFETETEITGPVAATLYVSSTTTDADIFCVLRVFDPDGHEVVLQGAVDPHTPIGPGMAAGIPPHARRRTVRAVAALASPRRGPAAHAGRGGALGRGDLADLDRGAAPATGSRSSVRGTDYEYEGADDAAELSHFKGSKMRGVGIYTHADPVHRPADIYGGTTTVHAGPEHPSTLLLPVIPPREG